MFPNLKSATFYNSIVILEKGPTKAPIPAHSEEFQNPNFSWE
jgi:hypothetical protein